MIKSQQSGTTKRNYKMDVNIISGKAYWASLAQPNTTFEPVWCVDVCLDEDTKKKVESLGVVIQNKGDDRGDFVKIKRKVHKKDGSERPSPVIKDSQNNTWDGSLVGNGSLVNVKFSTYDWTYAGKSGVATDLMGVQVVDLISYGGDGSNFDAVDGGYTVASQDKEGEEVPF
jgi:hypothetical protein